MSHITNIKGTKDILPDENVLWKETINLIHNFMSLHGYGLLDTPVFEKNRFILQKHWRKYRYCFKRNVYMGR